MSHPDYPLDLVLQEFQPLVIPFEKILAIFFPACALVLASGWYLTGEGFFWSEHGGHDTMTDVTHLYRVSTITGRSKFLSTVERCMACWFLCSGLIHLIVEGETAAEPKQQQ